MTHPKVPATFNCTNNRVSLCSIKQAFIVGNARPREIKPFVGLINEVCYNLARMICKLITWENFFKVVYYFHLTSKKKAAGELRSNNAYV